MVTLWPRSASCQAAERPPTPEPMMANFLPVEAANGRAGRSIEYLPSGPIRTEKSICWRVQAVMQGLGQAAPQTEAGKGMYCRTRSSASRNLPLRSRLMRSWVGMPTGQADSQGA